MVILILDNSRKGILFSLKQSYMRFRVMKHIAQTYESVSVHRTSRLWSSFLSLRLFLSIEVDHYHPFK
jgi:phosphopantetheine adenylyltransferase